MLVAAAAAVSAAAASRDHDGWTMYAMLTLLTVDFHSKIEKDMITDKIK